MLGWLVETGRKIRMQFFADVKNALWLKTEELKQGKGKRGNARLDLELRDQRPAIKMFSSL